MGTDADDEEAKSNEQDEEKIVESQVQDHPRLGAVAGMMCQCENNKTGLIECETARGNGARNGST